MLPPAGERTGTRGRAVQAARRFVDAGSWGHRPADCGDRVSGARKDFSRPVRTGRRAVRHDRRMRGRCVAREVSGTRVPWER
ncbi:hypothetical protein GCM10010381_24650 [Streptomyces xantholiticus]|nr:hypothetical protein GCM10010381_24650 [Streptomyces xantholiticus]